MSETASLVVVGRAGRAGVDAGRRGCSLELDADVEVVDAHRAIGRMAGAAIRLGPTLSVVAATPRSMLEAEVEDN
jgi:hypothetical protein